MAFLAVSAPFKHYRSRGDELLGRCRQDFLLSSSSFLQGTSLKKGGRQYQQQHQSEVAISATSYPRYPREQSSASSLSASILSPPADSNVGAREVYQPFRRPRPAMPGTENVSVDERIQILRERQGLWFDYAVHVPSLIRAGFTPPMIDEATGLTGVEQNKIVVAAQVRSSLQSSDMDPEALSFYDIGGADLLYELRILASDQRKSASLYALEHKMDIKEYSELARAMKDHERRKRDEGWESFSSCPGDCLAYSCYRLSKDLKGDEERLSTLQKGLTYAETEKAKAKLKSFLEKGEEHLKDEGVQSHVNIIRLASDEAGSPYIPCILPVVEPSVQCFEAAPSLCPKGPFTVQHADRAWETWVSLPAWESLRTAVMPVAISFTNAAILPWKQKKSELEEPIILIADRQMLGMREDAYYVVDSGDGKLTLQLGTVVSETGSRALGKVVLAVRPPVYEENDLDSIEWD